MEQPPMQPIPGRFAAAKIAADLVPKAVNRRKNP